MFAFENYPVYKTTQKICILIYQHILKQPGFSKEIKDQLQRASLSILLNITEGCGRYTKNEKKRFYITARGSCYECVSIINLLHEEEILDSNFHNELYEHLTNVSKMLSGMIKTFK
ncbi:four helix bundle protein [Candidatus Gracilibacteria bacterium]|nr:four helix bundle protein [Candidatus Gracilibacteria bacterium]